MKSEQICILRQSLNLKHWAELSPTQDRPSCQVVPGGALHGRF
jgi:hypothetical protein